MKLAWDRWRDKFRTGSQSPWFLAVILCLIARLFALLIGWVLWRQGLIPTHPVSPDQVYLDIAPVIGPLSGWTLGVWQRLDAIYYLQIAAFGYAAGNGTVVFPPLYPLAIRAVGIALGGQVLLAALLISTAACIVALAVLFQIAEQELDVASARRTILYLAFFPMAYVLMAPYAESLMLCLILLAFWWARQERWWLANVAACLATLTRLQAVILVLPLAYLYWRRSGGLRPALRPAVLAFAAAPLAVIGFDFYLAWQGLPSVRQEYARLWYSAVALPGTDFVLAIRALLTTGTTWPRALALGLTALFIFLTLIAFRRLPLEYGLYMAGILLVSLSRHEVAGRYLIAVSRHMLFLFPGFMVMGYAGRNPWLNRLILYSSLVMFLLLMGVFFMWGYAE
jgi:hypothetical protein